MTQLNTLISQRDQQQAVLTQVSQELEENRNAEATAKATLLDEQEYLSTIKAQEADTTAMYNQRMKDRAEEKKEWCEHELSETAKTKAHHEMFVEEFKSKIE